MVADGARLTVTVADPVLSPADAAQVPSVSVLIMYVVAEDGLTITVIVGAVPEKDVPSDRVPLMVPVPVALIVKLAEFPLHIVVVPLSAPVGRAG